MSAKSSGALAFIPARGGSKRVPRKNIIDFFGKPMICYPIAAGREAGVFDLIHVSTDDDEIADVARAAGADVSFRRPAELSDDYTPLRPVMTWTLERFAEQGRRFSSLCTLFPCAPLLRAEDLRQAYKVYDAHGGAHNLLSVARAPAPAEWYFHKSANGRLKPVHPGAAFMRSQDLQPAYYETGTFTIFSADSLLASPVQDDTNYIAYELEVDRAVDIDTPEDLERARRLFLMAQKERE